MDPITNFFIAYTIAGGLTNEYLSSKQLDLSEEARQRILEEGIYHFTTKENAEKIIQSGYLMTSKGLVANHFSKSRYGDKFADFVYMFGGKPKVADLMNNVDKALAEDGTFYAVRFRPNKFDINNFNERLSDGAVTHEGRLDIANSEPEIVRLQIRDNKVVEIPMDEQVERNPKIPKTYIGRVKKMLPFAMKRFGESIVHFKDKNGQLRKCIEHRKAEQKMLEQLSADSTKREYEAEKDGKAYSIVGVGAKMVDGRPLVGFRVGEKDGEFAKNVFMDMADLSGIPDEKLQEFITEHMNEESIRTEYIGKPVMINGEVHQEIDQEYAHHFYAKQLMTVKNDATYAEYVASEQAKKGKQLRKLKEAYKTVSTMDRTKAVGFLKSCREKVARGISEFIKDENGSIVLGGE